MVCALWAERKFLSTPSARRATEIQSHINYQLDDFYPRPPRGGRPKHRCMDSTTYKISIHALREEGDKTPGLIYAIQSNFYPRPPRGGRPNTERRGYTAIHISIHALREEGDFCAHGPVSFSPIFLSTPSARRAT